MKKLFFIAASFILFAACKPEKKQSGLPLDELAKIAKDTANYTQIQLIDSVKHFGEIKEGEKVEVVFKFKNIGTKNLYVTEVHAGCGCTTPDYSKEAIAPGKEGWIKGIYDSKNGHGRVEKYISFKTNTSNETDHKLVFDGFVKN